MNEPWFPVWFGGILGAGIGLLGGLYGTIVGTCAQRGIARSAVFAFHYSLLTLGIVMLGIAIAAFSLGQPYSDWYSFGLIGMILTILMTAFLPMLKKVYQTAEERIMTASHLSQ